MIMRKFFFLVIFMAALASARGMPVKLSVDKKSALLLQAPAGAKVVLSNGYAGIRADKLSLYIWAVADAKVVADALPRTADLIKSEFTHFQQPAVADLTLAGAPAKQVTGAGNEADDGDPGHAGVVLFEVGG